MGKTRSLLAKLADLLIAKLAVVLLVLAVIAATNLLARLFSEPSFQSWLSILNTVEILLAISAFGSAVYLRMTQSRQRREERSSLLSEIRLRLERVLESSVGYLILDNDEAKESIIQNIASRLAPRYHLSKIIDPDTELEIVQTCLVNVKKYVTMDEGKQLFLVYLYLTKYSPENIQIFLDRLNKRKMHQDKTAESVFLRLLTAHDKSTAATFEELESHAQALPKEELDATALDIAGQGPIYEKIAETAKNERRYENLKRIVSIVISQGYVSTRGLLPFLQTEGDILCVIKSEAGLSSSLRGLFKTRKEMTPFKRVLLDYGFIQPSRREYFTFILPLSRAPEQYRQNVHLFMEKEIMPKVRKDWERLYQTYGYKRLQYPTYGYLAFIVKRPDMSWTRVNMQFRQEFEDQILGKLTPKQTAKLIVTQIHSIPKILRKMEVDSLTTELTDSQRLALRESEPEIRREIGKELGVTIGDVTDYSKLESHKDAFSNILSEWINKKLPQRARKCKPETAQKVTEDILSNAIDIRNLIESLGVKV